MPKQRITKEMVVSAAFDLARAEGMERVMVKTIAQRLGCSVQPIYSYCENMERLRQDVAEQTKEFIRRYVAARVDPDDPFRSTGRAYIQLTQEEPQLFKIFVLHRRDGVASLDELYRSETDERVAAFIARDLGVSLEQARQLHLDMLIYTIGLGTIFAVTTPGIPAQEIFSRQERAYQIFEGSMEEGRHGR